MISIPIEPLPLSRFASARTPLPDCLWIPWHESGLTAVDIPVPVITGLPNAIAGFITMSFGSDELLSSTNGKKLVIRWGHVLLAEVHLKNVFDSKLAPFERLTISSGNCCTNRSTLSIWNSRSTRGWGEGKSLFTVVNARRTFGTRSLYTARIALSTWHSNRLMKESRGGSSPAGRMIGGTDSLPLVQYLSVWYGTRR